MFQQITNQLLLVYLGCKLKGVGWLSMRNRILLHSLNFFSR